MALPKRPDGHGFGFTAVRMAKELGGSLTVLSDGPVKRHSYGVSLRSRQAGLEAGEKVHRNRVRFSGARNGLVQARS